MNSLLQGKKLLLIGLVLMIGGVAVTKTVWARNPVPQGVDYHENVFKPAISSQDVNLQSTAYEIFLSILSSMRTVAVQDECDAACQQDMQKFWNTFGSSNESTPSLATIEKIRNRGLIPQLMAWNVSFLTKPPVSSTDYIAHVGEKLNLVSPAYAQGNIGFGYEGLRPAREIWTAFRNIAYLVATIGFVILSFMIMFRVRISPQTVIGAQQAIMKLVVVFLAVTFSYAIAGLIVDLIFVLSFVVITMFTSTGLIPGNPPSSQVQTELFSGNILRTAAGLISIAGNAGGVIQNILDGTLQDVAAASWVTDQLTRFFSAGVSTIGGIIISIALIYALFKLLFQLLLTYAEIIILTILAPLMILPDILPGGKSFMGWIRRMFANAMVFPTVTFLLLLGRALVGETVGDTAAGFEQGLRLPYLGFGGGEIQPLLGIAIILLMPKAVDMVKNALKVSAFQYSTAIGAALGFGAGRFGAAVSPAVNAATYYPRQIKAGIQAGTQQAVRGQFYNMLPKSFRKGKVGTDFGRGVLGLRNQAPDDTTTP